MISAHKAELETETPRPPKKKMMMEMMMMMMMIRVMYAFESGSYKLIEASEVPPLRRPERLEMMKKGQVEHQSDERTSRE